LTSDIKYDENLKSDFFSDVVPEGRTRIAHLVRSFYGLAEGRTRRLIDGKWITLLSRYKAANQPPLLVQS